MLHLQNNCYNIDIAKIFGVYTSILLSCLDKEYLYQSRNKLLNGNNTIPLSRSEIYERTALDDESQVEAEIALISVGILVTKPLQNVPNKNYYVINYNKLLEILSSSKPEEAVLSEKAKQFIKTPRVEPISKRQSHIISLKKKVKSKDPVVQTYLLEWIDAVYSNPKGFLSPSGVVIAQQELEAYCSDNQEKQIMILKIAIKGGLRDLTWAIETYEKQFKSNSRNFATYKDIKADKNVSDSEVY